MLWKSLAYNKPKASREPQIQGRHSTKTLVEDRLEGRREKTEHLSDQNKETSCLHKVKSAGEGMDLMKGVPSPQSFKGPNWVNLYHLPVASNVIPVWPSSQQTRREWRSSKKFLWGRPGFLPPYSTKNLVTWHYIDAKGLEKCSPWQGSLSSATYLKGARINLQWTATSLCHQTPFPSFRSFQP